MKKTCCLFLLFVGLAHISSGQSLNDYTKPTEEHMVVRGTNVFLIPPVNFAESSNFKGFQNPNDPTSMIMLMEIPGPYSDVTQGFNQEMLSAQGMTLKSNEIVRIGPLDGLLLEIDQAANELMFSKTILVFGDSLSTILVNGVCPKDSTELQSRISASVSSAVVDENQNADPRNELDYTLDETVGELQFLSVMGNGMLFNRDLKTPTESEDRAALMTDKSFAKTHIENKKLFCVSRLKKYPDDLQIIPDKGIEEIELDGIKGFELYALNTTDETEEIYQVILFEEDGGYYLIVGSYLKGSTKAENDIKAIVRTFSRK